VAAGLKLLRYPALDGEPAADLPVSDIQPWTTQSIVYTSGTTGPSKGVLSSYLHLCTMGIECMPTMLGRPSACAGALGHIAFHYTDSVGTRNQFSIAAPWLACTFPCRRFADILADACARLGADAVRYSFIVVDLHHLLLAGLSAHLCENALFRERLRIVFSVRPPQRMPRQFSAVTMKRRIGSSGTHTWVSVTDRGLPLVATKRGFERVLKPERGRFY
jgi:hypothetical protein